MTIIQLNNGTAIIKKTNCDFLREDGTPVEPPTSNNCYTYAFGTWVVRKGLGIYVNPGYTYSNGLEVNVSRIMFINKVLEDCNNLEIECECIPIEGKKKRIKSKLARALNGENKVLIKAFWAPRDRRDIRGYYGYYHFLRRLSQDKWIEVVGMHGDICMWDEEPEKVYAGKWINPVAYFVITE